MAKWECSVCGYLYMGDTPPENCPICKVPADRFTKLGGASPYVPEPAKGVAQQTGAQRKENPSYLSRPAMKEIRCEMCGSTDIAKQDGFFVCQSCGIKYSLEEARKLMVEVSGKVDVSGSTVKIDQTQRLDNLKIAARLSTKNKNYDTAASQWGEIQVLEPQDWEAIFFSSYCKTITRNARSDADFIAIKDLLKQALSKVKRSETDYNKRRDAIRTLEKAMDEFINVGIAEGNRLDRISEMYPAGGDYIEKGYWRHKIIEAGKLRCSFAEDISSIFNDEVDIQQMAVSIFKNGYRNLKESNGVDWELSTYERRCKSLQDNIEIAKQRKRDAETKAKSDAFWSEHQTEKNQLLKEKKILQDRIRDIQKSIDVQIKDLERKKSAIPQKEDLKRIIENIEALTNERGTLTIFSISKKRELSEKIVALKEEQSAIEQEINSKEEIINLEIQEIKNNLEITTSQNRISSIDEKIKYGRL